MYQLSKSTHQQLRRKLVLIKCNNSRQEVTRQLKLMGKLLDAKCILQVNFAYVWSDQFQWIDSTFSNSLTPNFLLSNCCVMIIVWTMDMVYIWHCIYAGVTAAHLSNFLLPSVCHKLVILTGNQSVLYIWFVITHYCSHCVLAVIGANQSQHLGQL